MLMLAFQRGKDLFIWTWHVKVMAFRMEGGHLGVYTVDGNAFQAIFSSYWFAFFYISRACRFWCWLFKEVKIYSFRLGMWKLWPLEWKVVTWECMPLTAMRFKPYFLAIGLFFFDISRACKCQCWLFKDVKIISFGLGIYKLWALNWRVVTWECMALTAMHLKLYFLAISLRHPAQRAPVLEDPMLDYELYLYGFYVMQSSLRMPSWS